MKKTNRILAVLTAAIMMISMLSVGICANAEPLVTYESHTASRGGYSQTVHTMTFNPADGLMPLAYQPKPSFGSTVPDSCKAAAAAGYDVYGGINGEFFSMASGNYGTLEGLIISNGKIVEDSENRTTPGNQEPSSKNLDTIMVIDKDNQLSLVQSRTAYHFYVEGKEQGNAIVGSINKRYNGTNWWDPLCYFDSNCGSQTYTISGCKGIEVVFKKTNNTELMIEGVLQGEVVSIHRNTYATSFKEDEFVLFAQNSSANYHYLNDLTVGKKVQIYCEETVAASKETMRKAFTVSNATYPIVLNGKNNIANIPYIATDIGYTTRAQRTAIGVKADGSYVYMCAANAVRNKSMTMDDVAAEMIRLGCVTAINLDGGGSSTMVHNGQTKYSAEGRAVASTILIVKRDNALISSPAAKKELSDQTARAKAGTYPEEQQKILKPIIAEADALLADAHATNGDYKRVFMQLQVAMGEVTDVKPPTYFSLKSDLWSWNKNEMNVVNEGSNLALNNTNNQWPYASYSCSIIANKGDNFTYNFTAAGYTRIDLYINGEMVIISKKMGACSGDDLIGNGQTFNGSIALNSLGVAPDKNGQFAITSVCIWSIGNAGNASKITVSNLGIDSGTGYLLGDANLDGTLNAADVRLILIESVNPGTLVGTAALAADYNQDGFINGVDARQVLVKTVSG